MTHMPPAGQAATAGPADPDPGPRSPAGTRRVVLPVVIGTLIGTVFVTVFVALFHVPTPHRLPVGVAGTPAVVEQIARTLETRQPGAFAVTGYADAKEATVALRHRDVYGAFIPGSANSDLLVAGANGPSATATLTHAFTVAAGADGGTVKTTDVVPTSDGDTAGLSTFYAGFGVVLAGFLFGQTSCTMAPKLPLRRRLAAIGIFGTLSGIAIALITGSLGFNALPGNVAVLAVITTLIAASVATATVTIIRLAGPAGTTLSAILLLILGNATGGGTLPIAYLPEWLQWLSEVLPVGVGIRAIKGLSYFNGDGVLPGILILSTWILTCVVILALRDLAARRPDPA